MYALFVSHADISTLMLYEILKTRQLFQLTNVKYSNVRANINIYILYSLHEKTIPIK